MPEALVYGFQAKLYYDSTTTPATPTWVEVDVIANCKVNLGYSESDASVRAAGGFELTEPVLQQASIEAELIWRNGNSQCTFLRNAFMAKTAVNMMALTGARTNTDAVGIKGDFKIVKWEQTEDLKEQVKVSLTIKPCLSTRSNFIQAAVGA